MDVRSPEDVEEFERTLTMGPITVVLVYADWCGHCTTFKKDIWSKLLAMKNKKMNLASVHHDMLEHTSQRDAKIKGYPSVLIVGNDKVPATFGDTNALPNYRNLPMLQKMITAKNSSAKTRRAKLTAPRLRDDIMKGGSLLAALTTFAKSSAPAFVLTGLAATVAKKRRTTRKKRVL
jgi:thioredoxin-like negative regulator of GroEL